MMQVYKLYASAAASTDSAASFDVRADGNIVGILMECEIDGPGANADGAIEVSFLSSSGFTTNDTTGSIAGLHVRHMMTTSGAANVAATQFVPMDVPCNSGERLFLHIKEGGTTSAVIGRVWVYIDEKGGSNRPRIARR